MKFKYWFYGKVASRLPFFVLHRMAKRFDTPGHFTCDVEEGSSWWMDASYAKWCRKDIRKEKRANPQDYYL